METSTGLSFKQIYILKAQSPLIHFQHNQKGATLRASEVKPELDRFLIKKLSGKVDLTPWLMRSGKRPALNYKLHFTSWGIQKKFDPPKIFYGNMSASDDEKVRCLLGDCKMELICFIPELMEIIDENIGEFFVCTNFGGGKSKGFGSYVIPAKTVNQRETAKLLAEHAGAKACYGISYSGNDRYKMFDDILRLYGVMKSGINHGGYQRSYLFRYCHEVLGIGNEKAAMKKEQISPWDAEGPVKHPDNKKQFGEMKDEVYHYVRALLGVGEHMEYIAKFKRGIGKNGEETWKRDTTELIKIENETIERLASPIMFKIVYNTLFIVANRIDPILFGQPFTFTNEESGKQITLTVPDAFDIDDFLAWFVDRYNEESVQPDENGRRNACSIGKTIACLTEGEETE